MGGVAVGMLSLGGGSGMGEGGRVGVMVKWAGLWRWTSACKKPVSRPSAASQFAGPLVVT